MVFELEFRHTNCPCDINKRMSKCTSLTHTLGREREKSNQACKKRISSTDFLIIHNWLAWNLFFVFHNTNRMGEREGKTENKKKEEGRAEKFSGFLIQWRFFFFLSPSLSAVFFSLCSVRIKKQRNEI